MKKTKIVFTLGMALILVMALAACGGGGGGGSDQGSAAKYEGEVTERTVADVLLVKYPAEFKVNETWSGDYNVCLSKDDTDWEVTVGCYKYDDTYPKFEALEEDAKAVFGDSVKPATLAGKDGFTYKALSAINYTARLDDTRYIVFTCKSKPNMDSKDFESAFKSAEVQYILENLSLKE